MATKLKSKEAGLKSPIKQSNKTEVFKQTMKKAREMGGLLVKEKKLKPL